MNRLKPIFCAEELQRGGIYQIDGCLYEYLYPDPYARSDFPKYHFRCLQGQRKKTDITLNRSTIRKANRKQATVVHFARFESFQNL